jgi:ABC-2 type transport system ATP-binding protein
MRQEPYIKIDGLSKRFGHVLAVDGVSFSVDKGEILGFLGPNGAGKSTTMRIASGYLRPTAGSVFVLGKDVQAEPMECRRHIGYLPEGGPLYLDMTADAFLRFVGAARGLQGGRLEERLDFVNEALQLAEVWNRPLETLSKGYRRRVALAQALLHDPDVLILDEPTDGLDPNQKREVHRLIKTMAETKAVVLSTHILEDAEQLCARTVMIAGGKIVARGTLDDVRAKAGDCYFLRISLPKKLPEELLQALGRIKHVRSAEIANPERGAAEYVISVKQGKAALAEVVKLLAEKGIYAEHVSERRPSLLDAFHQLTAAGGSEG